MLHVLFFKYTTVSTYLVCVMEMQCVVCDVGTQSLDILDMRELIASVFKPSQSVFFHIAGKPRYDLGSNEEVEYFSRGKFSCSNAILITYVQAVVHVAMFLHVQCDVRKFLTI